MKRMEMFKFIALVCMMFVIGSCSDDDTPAQNIVQEEETVITCSVEKLTLIPTLEMKRFLFQQIKPGQLKF